MEGASDEAREEVEAIRSIYPEFFVAEEEEGEPDELSGGNLILRIPAGEHQDSLYLELRVFLPPEYPSTSCALFELGGSALPFLGKSQLDSLEDDLYSCYSGGVVLFEWLEKLRTLLQELFPPGQAPPAKSAQSTPSKQTNGGRSNELALASTSRHQFELPWTITNPVVVQKSTFIGYAVRVKTVDEVHRALADLNSDKDIARATHRIWSYRLVGSDSRVRADRDDDGEEGASRFLSFMMEQAKVENWLLVVVRWYGGVLLGPLRFRVIQTVGRDALAQGGALTRK